MTGERWTETALDAVRDVAPRVRNGVQSHEDLGRQAEIVQGFLELPKREQLEALSSLAEASLGLDSGTQVALAVSLVALLLREMVQLEPEDHGLRWRDGKISA